MKTNRQNIKIVGYVTYGNGLGKGFGFPTANILPSEEYPEAEDGVWAGVCEIGGSRYKSVINIGYSPSVVEHGTRRIEAHIIDFEGDLYDKEITLTLLYHLRPERKFPSREELIAQIANDKEESLRLLSNEQ